MASNLDYLAPDLQPLEEILQAYLKVEKELAQAEIAAVSALHSSAETTRAFDQRPATGNYPQHTEEAVLNLQNLRDDLTRLRQQVLKLLPVRDEWVKVNLGYGPSRVGAFRPDTSQPGTDAAYELRVVI
ncbi:hypothetical protein [Hymenobacter metallilatus]|uniref:Flagellar protein FlgN n=1 Tax=Hymenobacter metallilatus TaxID=2493666 RepID=A0A3R9M534_9BACT|nr:hypothetical protein [Hymenobacter metallilatus]RSK29929.1 hypothetical protein EI290_16470 [Hymenobacter metallilatus]